MTENIAAPAAADRKSPPRKIGSLMMIWGFALRYPARIAAALSALVIAAAAQLSISWAF